MAKAKSKTFTASRVQRPAPPAGPTIPDNEFIKTTIVLRRQKTGGASQKDVDLVYAFLAQNHISVVEGSTPEKTLETRLIQVGATLRDYRAAGIDPGTLRWVKQRGITHRARQGALGLPASLQKVLLSWTGFDSRPAAVAHSRFFRPPKQRGVAQPATKKNLSFSVPDLARLYGFPVGKLTGKGQCIAIIELNDFDSKTRTPTGTGYTTADMDAYFKSIKKSTPTIVPVGVLGGANVPGPNPDADGEVALDIEVAGAVAPEATIVVYFAPNTDRGFMNAIHAAVFDSTYKPSIISISWGGPEDFSTQQYRDAMSAALEDAAANNVTVFVAAGDSGSSDLEQSDGKPHADFPGSNDKAISCGGLRTDRDLTESVWNDGVTGGSGGGGISNYFRKPTYQSGISIPKSPKHKVGRGVPDVSGTADPETGYQIVLDGKRAVIGGTSAVAPLYAGLFALVNQARSKKNKKPVGFCHDLLYKAPAAFRDIIQGNNDIDAKLGKYNAGPGWDACSGLGSPIGDKLLAALS
jgi:kumamolisin